MNELTPFQREFRQAMSSRSSAVNIITTAGEYGRLGLTVTAACSVTDEPPTVLVCVNRRSATRDIFVKNGRMGLNILAGDQEELARHFSGQTNVPMEERFEWDLWEDLSGVPVLRDARVALAGRVANSVEQGTHTVLFLEVEGIRMRDDAAGLVYDRRNFHLIGA